MAPNISHAGKTDAQQLRLPILVFGMVEVRRLKRELEALDEFMRQAALRDRGTQPALPRLSRLLDALAADNNRNLLLANEREVLRQYLETVEKTAPTVHISFASDPSSSFTAQLVGWLRNNIHPDAMLQVGLQPTIAAGCVVRTPNKVFDLSLRQRLSQQSSLLLEALAADIAKQSPPAPVVHPEAATS